MGTQWKSWPSLEAAAAACAADVVALLAEAVKERGRAAFAVSGGGPPKLLFAHLAAAAELDWSKLHVFFVDERCVPADHEASNFLMCRKHLLEPARAHVANVHRMKGELAPADGAADYAAILKAFFGEGVPRFDLILRGMGPDAHTASLFPGEPLIEDRDGLVAAVEVENQYRHRITLLPAVLLNARATFVLAGGAEKAEKLDAVFHGPRDAKAYPSQLDTPWAPWVTWYLDDAAAAPLHRS